MKLGLALISVILCVCIFDVHAQIPQTMSHQGVITNASGNPVPDGNVTLAFRLYDGATGGSPLWTETQTVSVSKGIFSTILGSVTPLSLAFDKPYWLGISISGGPELAPRVQLTSAPYAIAAKDIAENGKVVRNLNNLTDRVSIVGEGAAAVTIRENTIVVSAAPGAGGGGIVALQDPTGSIDITNPNGPNTSIKINNAGVKDFHIADRQVVKSLDGFRDAVKLVAGPNIEIVDKLSGIPPNPSEIEISALRNGGQICGNVAINGNVTANGLVTANGILVVGNGDTVARFNPDGTSFHKGRETFAGGFEVTDGFDVKDAQGNIRFTMRRNGFAIYDANGKLRAALTDSLFQMRDVSGNILTGFSWDGTSTHAALEVFGGGIEVAGDVQLIDNAAIIFPDGTVQTTAADTSGFFSGEQFVVTDAAGRDVISIGRNGIFVLDENGNITTSFLRNGNSFHAGVEDFVGGIFAQGPTTVGDDYVYVGARNSTPTLQKASVVQLPNVLFYAKDSTGSNTAGLFSSVSGERPSVYAEKKAPGSSSNSATSDMNEQLEILNRVTTEAQQDLPREFSQSLSQKNLPSIWGVTSMTNNEAVLGQVSSSSNSSAAMRGVTLGTGVGVLGQIANTGSAAPAVWGFTTGVGSGLLVDHNGASGNLAVLRSSGANQARIDKTGKGFFNGGTQTGGADVAEAFEVEGAVYDYEPGDVLVISSESDRRVEKSNDAYSTSVIGVYATKPGVLLTERSIDDGHEDTVPVGVVGVIPTKVSSENGPIRRGDLLVTSRTTGHAMRGTDRGEMLGAVIGKALENFDGSGTGIIKVMVNVK